MKRQMKNLFQKARDAVLRKSAAHADKAEHRGLQSILYRDIVENATDQIFVIDGKKKYLFVNKTLAHTLGKPAGELVGKSLHELYPKETADRFSGNIDEVFKTRENKILEEKMAVGSADLWISTRLNPIKDQAGEVNAVTGIVRDITARKESEEELKRSRSLLAKAQEIARLGHWEWDIVKNETLYSDEIYRIFGLDRSTFSGTYEGFLNTVVPEDRDFVARSVSEAVADARPYDIVHRIVLPGGTVRVVHEQGEVMRDESGSPLKMVGTVQDITELKRAEEEVRRLNEELEKKVEERTRQLLETQEELLRSEKLSVLGRLSGSVGHELRNPLGVMSNAVYFLKTVLSDADGTVKEYLDIIKNEIDNAQRIIADLLDFARTKPPQTVAMPVYELARKSLAKCSIPAEVSVNIAIPDALPDLMVDPHQMEQVLMNFITNAVQAMPVGGAVRIAARVAKDEGRETRDEGREMRDEGREAKGKKASIVQASEASGRPSSIEISVSDTGEGISPENLKKLFQPLFTTKARGIGLGLVVCKNLVEANGGTITVESEVGKGTTFTLTLPAEK